MEASQTTNDREATSYVILQHGGPEKGWYEVAGGSDDSAPIQAASGEGAVRKYVEQFDVTGESDLTGQRFVAIPSRSWRPKTVGGVEEVPAKRRVALG